MERKNGFHQGTPALSNMGLSEESMARVLVFAIWGLRSEETKQRAILYLTRTASENLFRLYFEIVDHEEALIILRYLRRMLRKETEAIDKGAGDNLLLEHLKGKVKAIAGVLSERAQKNNEPDDKRLPIAVKAYETIVSEYGDEELKEKWDKIRPPDVLPDLVGKEVVDWHVIQFPEKEKSVVVYYLSGSQEVGIFIKSYRNTLYPLKNQRDSSGNFKIVYREEKDRLVFGRFSLRNLFAFLRIDEYEEKPPTVVVEGFRETSINGQSSRPPSSHSMLEFRDLPEREIRKRASSAETVKDIQIPEIPESVEWKDIFEVNPFPVEISEEPIDFAKIFKTEDNLIKVAYITDMPANYQGFMGAAVTVYDVESKINVTVEKKTRVDISLSVTSDLRKLIATNNDGTIAIYNLVGNNYVLLKSFKVSPKPLISAMLSHDEKRIVGGTRNGKIQVWSESGNLITEEKQHDNLIGPIQVTSDGMLITGSRDGLVRLFNFKSNSFEQTIGEFGSIVVDIRLSTNEQRLAVALQNGLIVLFEKKGDKWSQVKNLNVLVEDQQRMVDHISFNNDASKLAGSERHGHIFIWDLDQDSSTPQIVKNTKSNHLMGLEWIENSLYWISDQKVLNRMTPFEEDGIESIIATPFKGRYAWINWFLIVLFIGPILIEELTHKATIRYNKWRGHDIETPWYGWKQFLASFVTKQKVDDNRAPPAVRIANRLIGFSVPGLLSFPLLLIVTSPSLSLSLFWLYTLSYLSFSGLIAFVLGSALSIHLKRGDIWDSIKIWKSRNIDERSNGENRLEIVEAINSLSADQLREAFRQSYLEGKLRPLSRFKEWSKLDIGEDKNRVAGAFVFRKISSEWHFFLALRRANSLEGNRYGVLVGKVDKSLDPNREKEALLQELKDLGLLREDDQDPAGQLESTLGAAAREVEEESNGSIQIEVSPSGIHARLDDFIVYGGKFLISLIFHFQDEIEPEVSLNYEHQGGQWVPLRVVLESKPEKVAGNVEAFLQKTRPESKLISGLEENGHLLQKLFFGINIPEAALTNEDQKLPIVTINGEDTGRTILKSERFNLQEGEYIHSAGVIVYRIDPNTGRVEMLTQRRGPNLSNYPNAWEVTGSGRRDVGEGIEETAVREVKEETSGQIKIDPKKLIRLKDLAEVVSSDKGSVNALFSLYLYPLSPEDNLNAEDVSQWAATDEVSEWSWKTENQIREIVDLSFLLKLALDHPDFNRHINSDNPKKIADGNNQWFYHVILVNWQVVFHLLVSLSMWIFGNDWFVAIPALIISSAIFSIWHPDVDHKQFWKDQKFWYRFAVGHIFGAWFIVPSFISLGWAIFISSFIHSAHNFLKLLGFLPKWTHLASGKKGEPVTEILPLSESEVIENLIEQKNVILGPSDINRLLAAYHNPELTWMKEEIRNFIFEQHVGIVERLSRNDPDDFQNGAIGLLNAIDEFPVENGGNFRNFATKIIRIYILKERLYPRLKNISDGKNIRVYLEETKKFSHKEGRFPTAEELASLTGMKLNTVVGVKAILEGIVEDPGGLQSTVDSPGYNLEMDEYVSWLLSFLEPDDVKIVELYNGFGRDKSVSSSEIANELGTYGRMSGGDIQDL